MADGTPEQEAPWLDTEQLRDWKSLVAMLMLLLPALDAQLKRDAGLNSFEYHVLASLSDAQGRTLAMSELAALAQGSASRLSHAVSRTREAVLDRASADKRPVRAVRGRRGELKARKATAS